MNLENIVRGNSCLKFKKSRKFKMMLHFHSLSPRNDKPLISSSENLNPDVNSNKTNFPQISIRINFKTLNELIIRCIVQICVDDTMIAVCSYLLPFNRKMVTLKWFNFQIKFS